MEAVPVNERCPCNQPPNPAQVPAGKVPLHDNATLPPMSDEMKAKLKFPFATLRKKGKGKQ